MFCMSWCWPSRTLMFLKKNFVRLLGLTLSIIIAEHTVKAKISVGQPLANFKVDICGPPYNMVTCLIQTHPRTIS